MWTDIFRLATTLARDSRYAPRQPGKYPGAVQLSQKVDGEWIPMRWTELHREAILESL